MGRWEEKRSVESYYSTSTKFLKDQGYFRSPGYKAGLLSWSIRGETKSSVNVFVTTTEDDGQIRFKYTSTRHSNGGKKEYDYRVSLVTTKCNYGGVRWWFICPLVNNGISCKKRVGVLYLGRGWFGCRQCYNLNYQSSKDSHKLDKMFWSMGINPKIGMKMFKEGF